MKIRRIDFSPDEWIAGTVTLSDRERGIYWQLCALIYSHGGPVLESDLRQSCSSRARDYQQALDRLLFLHKITREGPYLSQKRAIAELERSQERATKATQNGQKGGRPSNKINVVTKPDGFQESEFSEKLTINHQPSTINNGSSVEEPISKPNGLERASRKKPRKPFPPDWLPSEQDAAFARKRGRDDGWIAREAEKCRERHISMGNLFANLSAAWKTWVLRAPQFEHANGYASRPAKTADELWAWHSENYATRRIMLGANERSSPTDPDGKWFNADMVAAVEAAKRGKVRA